MSHQCLVKANNISIQFGDRQVLQHVNLSVHQGQIVTLIGPNGAGKTTLIRVILGLLPVRSGTVEKQPGLRIGYMPQKLHIEPTMPITVRRFLELAKRNSSEPIGRFLEEVQVSHLMDHQLGSISGGEMQRAALARVLVLQPAVLLLDEPTANLDPHNVALIESIVTELNQRQGVTVVLVTHNVFQARRLAQRAALLLGGQIVEVADKETFFGDPRDPRTQAFIKGDMVY